MATEREQHVAWCKAQALQYLDAGDLRNAVASMMSDMSKRDDTKVPSVLNQLAMLYLIDGDVIGVRRWITGFN